MCKLPVDAETAWTTILSEDFANQSYAHSDTTRELLSSEERNGTVFMTVRVTVNKPLPPMAAKVIGGNQLSWIQEQIVDHSQKTMRWKIAIPKAAKVQAFGSFSVKEDGDKSLRVVDGDVQVKIPIVGKKAEKHICAQLEESYERSARFTQDWLSRLS